MTTTTTTTPTVDETTAAPVPSTPKVQSSASITLRSDTATMMLLAERKADGRAITYAVVRDLKTKKNSRGLTETHQTFAAAQEHLGVLADKATKLGWTRGSRKAFDRKPDAFSALPSATAAKKGGAK